MTTDQLHAATLVAAALRDGEAREAIDGRTITVRANHAPELVDVFFWAGAFNGSGRNGLTVEEAARLVEGHRRAVRPVPKPSPAPKPRLDWWWNVPHEAVMTYCRASNAAMDELERDRRAADPLLVVANTLKNHKPFGTPDQIGDAFAAHKAAMDAAWAKCCAAREAAQARAMSEAPDGS